MSTPEDDKDTLDGGYAVRKWKLYDYFKDRYEQEIKSATYLMTAHAAGIAGCVTVLKELTTSSTFQGVGLLFLLFVSGLFFAVIGYVFMVRARSNMLIAVMASGPKSKLPNWVANFSEAAQFLSLVILFVGLFMIAKKLEAL